MMGATPFTEVVHGPNAQGPDDQAPRANTGDMMVESPERMPLEKLQRLSGETALAETQQQQQQLQQRQLQHAGGPFAAHGQWST